VNDRFKSKEYRVYFLTLKEYTKFDQFDMQFKVKAVYYVILFSSSVVL